MTKEDIERVDEMVNDFGEDIAKEVKGQEVEFLAWLTAARDNLNDQIVSAARLGPDDDIVEVGAGLGSLTERLAAKARRVLAVEIERPPDQGRVRRIHAVHLAQKRGRHAAPGFQDRQALPFVQPPSRQLGRLGRN